MFFHKNNINKQLSELTLFLMIVLFAAIQIEGDDGDFEAESLGDMSRYPAKFFNEILFEELE